MGNGLASLKGVELGFFGENLAKKYLVSNNYQILISNLKIFNFEIDIVARDNLTSDIVFFEVKTSKNNYNKSAYHPYDRVDWTKIKKIQHAAQKTIIRNFGAADQAWRIDILSLVINPELCKAKLQHFKNV